MFGKKKDLNFTHFVYTVFDSVSKKYRGTFYHSTDEEMIRTTLPSILMDFPLRDIEIHRIGMFNEDTGDLSGSHHIIIPTNCYTFPHSRLSSVGDDLSQEELDKAMKEKKVDLITKINEQKEAATKAEKKSKEA